jgi:hypothetical protein
MALVYSMKWLMAVLPRLGMWVATGLLSEAVSDSQQSYAEPCSPSRQLVGAVRQRKSRMALLHVNGVHIVAPPSCRSPLGFPGHVSVGRSDVGSKAKKAHG